MKNEMVTPEAMTVICNIQAMKRQIFSVLFDAEEEFYELSKLSIDDLRAEQDKLIPSYNESIRLHGKRN